MLRLRLMHEDCENPAKNLAIEALRKLINGEVRSQSARNVTQSRAFSERLEAAAIARYHSNAITTVEVLEQLIQIRQGHPGGAGTRGGDRAQRRGNGERARRDGRAGASHNRA